MPKAEKTLQLFEKAVALDQGSEYRRFLRPAVESLTDAYRVKEDGFRTHLGASLIGRECARQIWYGFRWATAKKFTGRIVRLLNRGHLEEARFLALLQACGIEVWTHAENGQQFRVGDETGHFGGSLDALLRGIPDLPPAEVALGEFKTHGDKSFKKLLEDGLVSAKWEHYVQMQIYMGKNGLGSALYLAVNKNDDEIYAEVVAFDAAVYSRYTMRARDIVWMLTPPKRINESPTWFMCKMCDHVEVCFRKVLPCPTCRSCAMVRPAELGTWLCAGRAGWQIPPAVQLIGCEHYMLLEDFQK